MISSTSQNKITYNYHWSIDYMQHGKFVCFCFFTSAKDVESLNASIHLFACLFVFNRHAGTQGWTGVDFAVHINTIKRKDVIGFVILWTSLLCRPNLDYSRRLKEENKPTYFGDPVTSHSASHLSSSDCVVYLNPSLWSQCAGISLFIFHLASH